MSKHTKGPWRQTTMGLASQGATMIFQKNEDGSLGRFIANTYGNPTSNIPECEANAKLIAAAPELLEACQKLLNAPHYDHFAARLNDEEMKGLNMIKEAVKKATL